MPLAALTVTRALDPNWNTTSMPGTEATVSTAIGRRPSTRRRPARPVLVDSERVGNLTSMAWSPRFAANVDPGVLDREF